MRHHGSAARLRRSSYAYADCLTLPLGLHVVPVDHMGFSLLPFYARPINFLKIVNAGAGRAFVKSSAAISAVGTHFR